MSPPGTILIVDDDPMMLKLHSMHVTEIGYEAVVAENGEEACKILESTPIDLVVSDIKMPGMDGYELCKWIRQHDETTNIPLIFASALVDPEEQMRGFEVGADDYIVKPVLPDKLLPKISRLLEIKNNNSKLSQQANESFSTAMQAMMYSSQLGQIIEFFKKSQEADSLHGIAAALFDYMAVNGLRCTIQFQTQRGAENFGDRGEVSPLEKNVIELGRGQSRFFDFGARTIVNYDDFSFLVKNMPLDDKEKYGNLKDTFGTLGEVIAARVHTLLVDDRDKQRQQVLMTVQEVINDISTSLAEIQKTNVTAIEGMIQDIDMAMITLGLSEAQEEQIRAIATHCLEKVDDSFDQGEKLNDEFTHVQERLASIFAKAS